jgi:hypothetical protein
MSDQTVERVKRESLGISKLPRGFTEDAEIRAFMDILRCHRDETLKLLR